MLVYGLEERSHFLDKVISRCKEQLKVNSSTGKIRASHSGKSSTFYIYEKGQDSKGKYLRKDATKEIRVCVQRDYYEKALKLAEAEKKHIDVYLRLHSPEKIKLLFEKMPKAKKQFIEPFEVDDETYKNWWMKQSYSPQEISEEIYPFYTDNGEHVRSKSEVIIANKLQSLGVPYFYEAPVKIVGNRIFHPDFKILKLKTRETIYLEHCGMMLNPEYVSEFLVRRDLYIRSGFIPGKNLIYTFESSENPLNTRELEIFLREILELD